MQQKPSGCGNPKTSQGHMDGLEMHEAAWAGWEIAGASAPSASATLAQAFRTEASAKGEAQGKDRMAEASGTLRLRLLKMGF